VAGTCGYSEEISGSINAGNFLTSCKFHWLASQDGLCSIGKTTTNRTIKFFSLFLVQIILQVSRCLEI
jgi:hypothetical protein